MAAQLRRAYRYHSPYGDEMNVEGLGHKTHWATCEKCNYMGPREKFEKESWRGDGQVLACSGDLFPTDQLCPNGSRKLP